MSETNVRRALYGKMAGDTTLTNLLGAPVPGFNKAIYHGSVPEDPDEVGFPYVIFFQQVGVPTYAMATTPAFETDTWLIKGVDDDATADKAEAIAARLISLLNDGTLSISGATQLYTRRQSRVGYSEVVDGRKYWHVGGLYRLLHQSP